MSVTVGGSTPQLTFADATVQNTAALPLTGGSVSADITVNGLTVGKGSGSVATNTVVGSGALTSNSTGQYITAVGRLSAPSTTAGANDAFGYASLYTNSSGINNVALGFSAGYYITGSNNTAVGNQALSVFSTAASGSNNTALGYQSLFNNTTASNNTAVGYQAGYSNTTGTGLTAFGSYALQQSTGNGNSAFGGAVAGTASGALQNNTSGSYNSGFGSGALGANTTGGNNIAVGYQALTQNTTASNNTAVGYQAGYTNATGTGVTYIGGSAGSQATANGNTFVGYNSGGSVTSGANNTILGSYSGNQGGLDIRTASNYIVLSDGAGNPRGIFDNSGGMSLGSALLNVSSIRGYELGTGGGAYTGNVARSYTTANGYWNNSNWVRQNANYACQITYDHTSGTIVTNTAVSGAAGSNIGWVSGPYVANLGTSWTNASDENLKNITGEITNALDKVSQLRAATYTWKADESNKPQVGLIAQDLLKVLPEVVVVPKEKFNDEGKEQFLGVNYDSVIPLLVAAIKEQQALITDLQARLTKAGL